MSNLQRVKLAHGSEATGRHRGTLKNPDSGSLTHKASGIKSRVGHTRRLSLIVIGCVAIGHELFAFPMQGGLVASRRFFSCEMHDSGYSSRIGRA